MTKYQIELLLLYIDRAIKASSTTSPANQSMHLSRMSELKDELLESVEEE